MDTVSTTRVSAKRKMTSPMTDHQHFVGLMGNHRPETPPETFLRMTSPSKEYPACSAELFIDFGKKEAPEEILLCSISLDLSDHSFEPGECYPHAEIGCVREEITENMRLVDRWIKEWFRK